MRHVALWFGAGAEYRDADSLQTHTLLFEKAALSREPCLQEGTCSEGAEGADAFWSEGASLRISWERKLCIAFEAIRTRVTPVNLHKVRFCFFLPLFSTDCSAATEWQVAGQWQCIKIIDYCSKLKAAKSTHRLARFLTKPFDESRSLCRPKRKERCLRGDKWCLLMTLIRTLKSTCTQGTGTSPDC